MSHRHRVPSWRSGAIAGLLTVLIVSSLAGGILFWQSQAAVATATRDQSLALIVSVSRAIGRQFERASRLGIPLDAIPAIDQSLYKMLGNVPGLARITLFDTQNRILGSAERKPGIVGGDIAYVELTADGSPVGHLEVTAAHTTLANAHTTLALEFLPLCAPFALAGGLFGALYAWQIQRHRRRLLALLQTDPGDLAMPITGPEPLRRDILGQAWHAAEGLVAGTSRLRIDLAHQVEAILAVDFDGRMAPRIAALGIARPNREPRIRILPPHPVSCGSLRLRLTLTTACCFAALIGLFAGLQAVRGNILQQQAADIAQKNQRKLWEQFVSSETRAITAALRDIAFLPLDQPAAADALKGHQAASLDQLALVDPNRQIHYILGQPPESRLLDASTLDDALAGKPAAGLRNLSDRVSMMISAQPIALHGDTWVLIGGRSLEAALWRYDIDGADEERSAHFLNAKNILVASTAPKLWGALHAQLPQLPQRRPAHFIEDHEDRILLVNATPAPSLSGGTSGMLITLTDATALIGPRRDLWDLSLLLAIGLALFGLIFTYRIVWKSLRPLQATIQTLGLLSSPEGNTSRPIDEIGTLSHSISAFRHKTEQLARDRAQQDRIRRRQEAVIARELGILSNAIDASSRQEIQAMVDRQAGVQDGDDNLRYLAEVMGDMRQRLIEQHQRLSTMVIELRDALITKTALAGLQQELQIARAVQLSILPRTMPDDPRVELNCHVIPAREVGGDFYDYYMFDEHHIGFVIADVSGKGIPAALFMAISRTLLKAMALFVTQPSACIQRLNALLSEENEQMLFVTLFYAVLNLKTGQLDYVNAGHHAPWLIRGESGLAPIPPTRGPAVGVIEDALYPQRTLQLRPGDTLYLYTDGITEAFSPEGAAYGDARLAGILRAQATDAPLETIAQTVITDVRDFERGTAPSDDITSLCLRYHGASPRTAEA